MLHDKVIDTLTINKIILSKVNKIINLINSDQLGDKYNDKIECRRNIQSSKKIHTEKKNYT